MDTFFAKKKKKTTFGKKLSKTTGVNNVVMLKQQQQLQSSLSPTETTVAQKNAAMESMSISSTVTGTNNASCTSSSTTTGWVELDEENKDSNNCVALLRGDKQQIQTGGKALTALSMLTTVVTSTGAGDTEENTKVVKLLVTPNHSQCDGGKNDATKDESLFKWSGKSKSKKNKAPVDEREPPKTWAERNERRREASLLPSIDSSRDFPTLGKSSNVFTDGTLKLKPVAAEIATSNPWFSLNAEENEESEDENDKKNAPTTTVSPVVEDDGVKTDDLANVSRFGLKKKKKITTTDA